MHRCATPAAFDNQIWHLLYDWDRCAAALQLQPLWENPYCICRLTGTALRPGAATGAAAPY